MKVVYLKHIDKFDSNNKSIALGFFDGFHIGHIKVLNDTLSFSKNNSCVSSLITFNMSFNDYFNKSNHRDLFTIDDKIDKASKLGFDEIVIIELTEEFLSLSKDEFIDCFLKDSKHVSVGFDYTFGKNREGNSLYLKEKLKNIVSIIDCVEQNGSKVGTKEIKEALDNADLKYVKNALNSNYVIHGCVFIKQLKYYLNSENYVPRSGEYLVIFDGVKTNIKIKLKKDINSIYLKVLDDFEIDEKIYNHKIEFIEYKKKES